MRKYFGKRPTLKLDAAWKPIEVINSFKGYTMCYTGRAKGVRYYDEDLPSVIVLNTYVRKRPLFLNCTRKNVFWRDKNICQYCNNYFEYKSLTMDHVIPKSCGGLRDWDNIVTACHSCNSKKANRTPEQANMPLLNIPIPPKVGILDFYRSIAVPKDWEPFLY